MRIPLLRGRFFTSRDDEHAPLVAVVDDVFARTYFGDQDPIGRRVNLFSAVKNAGAAAEIIGVVAHVKQWGLDADDKQQLRSEMYRHFMQLPEDAITLAAPGTGVV